MDGAREDLQAVGPGNRGAGQALYEQGARERQMAEEQWRRDERRQAKPAATTLPGNGLSAQAPLRDPSPAIERPNSAPAVGEDLATAKALYEQGAVHLRCGRVVDALQDYERALALAIELNDRPLQGSLRLAISRAKEGAKAGAAPMPGERRRASCPAVPEQGKDGRDGNLVQELMNLGVTESRAKEAAQRCSTIEAAVEWLLANGGM